MFGARQKMSVTEEHFKDFLEIHEQQLTTSNIPTLYWPTLYFKLKHEVYDAGPHFQMQQVVGVDDESVEWRVVVTDEDGISNKDPEQIYLIDHAWTYRMSEARLSLEQVPGLAERMGSLMGLHDESSHEDLVEHVLAAMWKYNQTYRFGHHDFGSDDSMPMWYVMDEFGNRIQHSDEPSMRVVPFFNAETNLAYSLLWPIKSLVERDEVTRDYCENVTDFTLRSARLLPWRHMDMKHIDFHLTEPDLDYFTSFIQEETLPHKGYEYPGQSRDKSVRVYLEYLPFKEFLTDPRFELVDDPMDTDVLWFYKGFKDFRRLSKKQPSTLINQFPNEKIVTVKKMLAVASRRKANSHVKDPMKSNPPWLPVTYNLQTELPKFVSYFQHREKLGLDNHWICKPWNLARGLDMYISKDVNQIVRLPDSGPKIACKYIEDPVLFYRSDFDIKVKFDIRYLVMLSCIQPLKLFVHEVFFLRFANKQFSLDHLDDYEKHFTVMNYIEGSEQKLKQVHYFEFIPEFEAQFPNYTWPDIQSDIFQMLRETFEGATALPAPQGIANAPQSRALYAVDLMLAWNTNKAGEKFMQPMLCEVNFSPDCTRACKYHPNIINEIFSVMFLDDTEGKHVIQL